jgi:lysophospholipase L1-like esterase
MCATIGRMRLRTTLAASAVAVLVLALGSAPAGAAAPYDVALGDSVAAGDGLQDLPPPNPCDQSTLAYPSLLAANPAFVPAGTPFQSAACTGATTENVLSTSETVNGVTVPSQLSQVASLPLGTVTLTVGVNDLDWVSRISTCLEQGYSACEAMQPAVTAGIATVKANVAAIVKALVAQGAARVIVTGYYDPFPTTAVYSTASCDLQYVLAIDNGLGNGTITLIRSWEKSLNRALSGAAKSHGGTFVPITRAIPAAHRICTARPWLFGLTSTTIANQSAMHPNAQGQSSIAATISAAVPAG